MAESGSGPESSRSFFSYYGQNAQRLEMVVAPEELEFFAQQELVTVVPNFSLDGSASLPCIGGNFGPFQPNMPTDVPLWMATMLHNRKKCRIQPPGWMNAEHLQGIFDEEKRSSTSFQPLPFYYLEVAQSLFRENPTDTFGAEGFGKIRDLLEAIRKVRYHKIESGLRKVENADTIKLNNLAAAECNLIRLLFKGSLDHFYELTKNDKAWKEASLASVSLSEPL
mmetsp:Transcript_8058/g.21458  ORF Transcript_8058/g.21458 Transcript_8058/m.21458 type:complete len:224 (+) Transcript_8058:61-732(+)